MKRIKFLIASSAVVLAIFGSAFTIRSTVDYGFFSRTYSGSSNIYNYDIVLKSSGFCSSSTGDYCTVPLDFQNPLPSGVTYPGTLDYTDGNGVPHKVIQVDENTTSISNLASDVNVKFNL